MPLTLPLSPILDDVGQAQPAITALLTAHDGLVALGTDVMSRLPADGSGPQTGLSGAIEAVGKYAGLPSNPRWEIADVKIVSSSLKAIWGRYFDSVKQLCPRDPKRLLALLAVRAVLDWFESVATGIQASQTAETEKGKQGTANVKGKVDFSPQIFGVGFGGDMETVYSGSLGSKTATSAATSWASSVKRILVPLRAVLDMAVNYECPTELPSIADGVSAFLRSEMDGANLRRLVELRGGVWQQWEKVILAQRQYLNAGEILTLHMREFIDRPAFLKRMRELGFLDQQEVDNLLQLAQQIPPFTDLIRMMVRDTADLNVVNTFGMDSEFSNKWADPLKKWGVQQGISDDVMRMYWRAHWDIPSPTQLFTMFQRLRNLAGVPIDEAYQRIGIDRNQLPREVRDMHPGAKFSDIVTGLIQQDILPFWIPKYLAIAFLPLTRVDTRRAFDIGVINRDKVKSTYTDVGYNDENAEILTKFTERLKILRVPSFGWGKAYIEGAIGVARMEALAKAEGYVDAELPQVKAILDRRAEVETRRACARANRQRFLLGDVDIPTMTRILIGEGHDPAHADMIVRRWECERLSRSKLLRATELIGIFDAGVITAAELAARLVNLGYSADDAAMMVQRAAGKMSQRAVKEAQAAAKRIAQSVQQQQRQTQQEQQRLAKQQASAAKARISAAAKRDQREKRILAAAAKVAAHQGRTVDPVAAEFRDQIRRLRGLLAVSEDDLVTISEQAALAIEKQGIADVTIAFNAAANALGFITEQSGNGQPQPAP